MLKILHGELIKAPVIQRETEEQVELPVLRRGGAHSLKLVF